MRGVYSWGLIAFYYFVCAAKWGSFAGMLFLASRQEWQHVPTLFLSFVAHSFFQEGIRAV
jgi:hypothetical protein